MPRARSRTHIILSNIIPRILSRKIRGDDVLVKMAGRGLDDGVNEPGVDFGSRVLENDDVAVAVVVLVVLDVDGRILLRVSGQQVVEFSGVFVCSLLEIWQEALRQALEFFDFEADDLDDVFDFDFVVQRPDDFGAEACLGLGCATDVHILKFIGKAGDIGGFVSLLVALGCLAQALEVVVHAL